jgi:hypothetical protein
MVGWPLNIVAVREMHQNMSKNKISYLSKAKNKYREIASKAISLHPASLYHRAMRLGEVQVNSFKASACKNP